MVLIVGCDQPVLKFRQQFYQYGVPTIGCTAEEMEDTLSGGGISSVLILDCKEFPDLAHTLREIHTKKCKHLTVFILRNQGDAAALRELRKCCNFRTEPANRRIWNLVKNMMSGMLEDQNINRFHMIAYGVKLDFDYLDMKLYGQPMMVTDTQRMLYTLLVMRNPEPVTIEELIRTAMPPGRPATRKSIAMHIHRMNETAYSLIGRPIIRYIRGSGYVLIPNKSPQRPDWEGLQ